MSLSRSLECPFCIKKSMHEYQHTTKDAIKAICYITLLGGKDKLPLHKCLCQENFVRIYEVPP